MKLLSIDVGMKNLAYCLLDVSADRTYAIEEWDVVDICDVSRNVCCHAGCTREPRFVFESKTFCKAHAKQTPLGIPTPDLNPRKLQKLTLKELYAFAAEHSIEFVKPILKKQLLDKCLQYIETHFVGLIQTTKASDLDLIQLGRNMTKHFDSGFKDKRIDYLLIENQISPLASRMKTLQGMITQYFINKDVSNIQFVSAANKLKGFASKPVSSYSERKKLGIQVTKELLLKNNLQEKLDLFLASKKKDDLSDAFLQALWFIGAQEIPAEQTPS